MRRATIRTDHGDAATARAIAAAVRPDNTDEMETTVDGTTVTTTVRRETTGGLHSTVDDYVVNLHVGAQLANRTDTPAPAEVDASTDGSDTEVSDDSGIEDNSNTNDTSDTDNTTHTDT